MVLNLGWETDDLGKGRNSKQAGSEGGLGGPNGKLCSKKSLCAFKVFSPDFMDIWQTGNILIKCIRIHGLESNQGAYQLPQSVTYSMGHSCDRSCAAHSPVQAGGARRELAGFPCPEKTVTKSRSVVTGPVAATQLGCCHTETALHSAWLDRPSCVPVKLYLQISWWAALGLGPSRADVIVYTCAFESKNRIGELELAYFYCCADSSLLILTTFQK